MLNLVNIQDAILTSLENSLATPVFEQAIPDASPVRKVSGEILPYVALQFGDLQDRISGLGFTGVRANDYELPIYIQVVAANPEIARKIASGTVLDAMLGLSLPGTGEVRKRPGGGMWPIVNSNGATEAYLVPSSWAVTVQLQETT